MLLQGLIPRHLNTAHVYLSWPLCLEASWANRIRYSQGLCPPETRMDRERERAPPVTLLPPFSPPSLFLFFILHRRNLGFHYEPACSTYNDQHSANLFICRYARETNSLSNSHFSWTHKYTNSFCNLIHLSSLNTLTALFWIDFHLLRGSIKTICYSCNRPYCISREGRISFVGNKGLWVLNDIQRHSIGTEGPTLLAGEDWSSSPHGVNNRTSEEKYNTNRKCLSNCEGVI